MNDPIHEDISSRGDYIVFCTVPSEEALATVARPPGSVEESPQGHSAKTAPQWP